MPETTGSGGLRDFDWRPYYSHEDGDLVEMFYVPALERSASYRRITGYFSGDALALAARGLDALIRRKGKMQLIVGCTLQPGEVESIDSGYKLRDLVASGFADRMNLSVEDDWARTRLGWLAWMIANGHLDVRLAIPKDERGRFRPGLGLYHAKSGLVADEAGDRLVFTGSINETEAGWKRNCEAFTTSCSWRGQWDVERVTKLADEFDKLWENKAKSAEVLEFPDALRLKLLQFLPEKDTWTAPKDSRVLVGDEAPADYGRPAAPPQIDPETVGTPEPVEAKESVEERRRKAWQAIIDAPKRPDGQLVAVQTSMVKPWPHQLRAYKRMLDSWPFRLLIADEVGLGKTIEAGLMIRHAWISGLAKRILIMTPKAIITQWQAELYEKFNLLVPIYTGSSLVWPEFHFRSEMGLPLEEKVGRDEWTKRPLVLTSSHLMRRTDRQRELIEAEPWELLVVDEAHHARRKAAGTPQEKGPNQLLSLLQKIEAKAKSLLLMTATPMQVHPVEIWDLLKVLGLPPEWDSKSFLDYFDLLAQNPDVQTMRRLAGLLQSAEAAYGQIPTGDIDAVASKHDLTSVGRTKVLDALRDVQSGIPLKRLTSVERKAAVDVLKMGSPVRFRMSRHTRPLLREYHRKGLLQEPIAEREVDDVAVELSPAEREVYEAVENYISTTYAAAAPEKKNAVGFVMTIYRRRLASSFHALRKTLERRLAAKSGVTDGSVATVHEDLAQDEQVDEAMSEDDALALEAKALDAEERESILAILKDIAKLGTDSKALELVQRLKSAMVGGYDSAIVFTQYSETMDFLKEFLADRLDLPVGCYSGGGGQRRDHSGAWTMCSKAEMKRLFREGQVRVLVCTDAAGEGLNLQSCGVIVNSDLPWNPMKVEQRIGRIDRIGQAHQIVRIVNLAYKDTVEADVYFALQERIGLFNGVVGKLQPILSRIPRQFETAALASKELRAQARHEARAQVVDLVDQTAAAGFDIDEVSDAALTAPVFPACPMTNDAVDFLLSDPDMLAPGFECRPLEEHTYALVAPGSREAARITTSPEVFDDHFENHQYLAADSPLFHLLAGSAIGETESGN